VQIFLIRHPAPAVSPSVCYGHSDVALAENMQTSLASLAAGLRQQLPANIPVFSSPLSRCRQLADLLHPAVQYDSRLREMHFGAWELQNWDGIPRAEIDGWSNDTLHYMPPGGESVAQMRERVLAFMDEQRQHEAIAIISHAGVMKILAGRAQQLPVAEWIAMRFDYGSLHRLHWPA
jgi:alpha-ribazole phosphatase